MDLVGLTNALTDVVIQVSDDEINYLGLKKGFNTRPTVSKEDFLKFMEPKEKKLVQGGSPANVLNGASKLGLNTALFGTVGNDKLGAEYLDYLRKNSIKPIFSVVNGPSAVCYILVAPDGEKTPVADLGVGNQYYFDLRSVNSARMFHTSAYELVENPRKVIEMMSHMKKIGAKLSFDLADPRMITKERNIIASLIRYVDVLFATEEEAKELTGKEPKDALVDLSNICDVTILKMGKNGSIVKKGNEQYEIPIYPVKLVNTNGAGDSYAAGFLFAYLKNFPIEECGRMGSYIASRVCAREEPHL